MPLSWAFLGPNPSRIFHSRSTLVLIYVMGKRRSTYYFLIWIFEIPDKSANSCSTHWGGCSKITYNSYILFYCIQYILSSRDYPSEDGGTEAGSSSDTGYPMEYFFLIQHSPKCLVGYAFLYFSCVDPIHFGSARCKNDLRRRWFIAKIWKILFLKILRMWKIKGKKRVLICFWQTNRSQMCHTGGLQEQ